jgi:hypothetical protein
MHHFHWNEHVDMPLNAVEFKIDLSDMAESLSRKSDAYPRDRSDQASKLLRGRVTPRTLISLSDSPR